MPNLTLHPLWHTFMPAYQHAIGVCTHSLSALAFYLMLKKTPKPTRPFARYLMLLQAAVTFVDFNFGFLATPIGLYPIPGALCNGVLCTVFGNSGHFGIILMFLSVSYVAVAIIYSYHFKFVTILRMAKHRTIPENYNVCYRVAIFIIYHGPCFMHVGLYRNLESGSEYTRINFPSLHYLFESPNYRTFVYDPSVFIGYTIIFASVVIFIMTLTFVTIAFFGFGCLYLLSLQIASISDKTKNLQKKTVITLVVQTAVVGIIQFVPLVVYAYSIITISLTPDINNCWFCFQMTHAIVHTIVLIAITPSYREALMCVRKTPKKNASVSATSVLRITH